jgi:hypothetical protein
LIANLTDTGTRLGRRSGCRGALDTSGGCCIFENPNRDDETAKYQTSANTGCAMHDNRRGFMVKPAGRALRVSHKAYSAPHEPGNAQVIRYLQVGAS